MRQRTGKKEMDMKNSSNHNGNVHETRENNGRNTSDRSAA